MYICIHIRISCTRTDTHTSMYILAQTHMGTVGDYRGHIGGNLQAVGPVALSFLYAHASHNLSRHAHAVENRGIHYIYIYIYINTYIHTCLSVFGLCCFTLCAHVYACLSHTHLR